MRITITLFLSLACLASQAQTKIIAHRSHSGSDSEFAKALENDLFDIDEDNLGMAPERFEIKKKNLHPSLDSVIFVSHETAIVVTSNHCTMENLYYKEETKDEVWNAGTEIAKNHPLFSKQHSLDSIKRILKNEYGFENNIDNVVFVGYDNEKPVTVTDMQKTDIVVKEDKKRKSGIHIDKAVLAVLGLTIATFLGGLFMMNRGSE